MLSRHMGIRDNRPVDKHIYFSYYPFIEKQANSKLLEDVPGDHVTCIAPGILTLCSRASAAGCDQLDRRNLDC